MNCSCRLICFRRNLGTVDCWNGFVAPLVGEEGEDVDSDETDKEAENDRPQDKPNIPSTRADFLKDILSRYFFFVKSMCLKK